MNNSKQSQSPILGIVVCLILCFPFLTSAQDLPVSNNITRVEYFWDVDPGYGNAIPLSITPGEEVSIDTDIAVPDTMTNGTHRLFVRAKSNQGWSPVLERLVSVKRSVKNNITRVEYYWDVDPGYGNATPLSITPGEEVSINTDIVVPDTMANGTHRLFVRAKSNQGWSPVLERFVSVKRSVKNNITRVEYFWDVDPGYGKGEELAFTTSGDSVIVNDNIIPADSLAGEHHLYVRALSEEGQWSPVCVQTINVGIEGLFTLNETLPEGTDRNFVSLTELFETLTTDDVRGDIDVVVRDGATFEYDATDSTSLALVNEARISLEQYNKHILFKASENTNTAISFNANSNDKSAVLALMSSFMGENVAITLNGVEYDFNAFNEREQELCSGDTSEELDFSGITADENVTIAWAVKPHKDMAVKGYAESGTGNLPAMTLTNHNKVVDYVEYDLALLNGSDTVTVKNYKIYVYTRVSEKSFTSMTPQNGASVDPISQTLSWNSILGANSYRLYITKQLTADVESGVVANTEVTVVDLKTTSHTLNVESGYTYDWKVTAYGRCDSLQSVENRFNGRLLSDLTMNFVAVPEYAFAGAPFSISAVVTNNGEGATTETTWNDVLYYSLSSNDITTATKLATVSHNGNIAPGESYTVTFNAKMPDVDEGVIYLFVATDESQRVMEVDDKNNSAVSTAIDCEPFIMNAQVHTALAAFYNALGGDNWSKKWNIASDNITSENYPGVTFNANGEPTAIALENNGIVCDVTDMTFDLPQLETLNLAKNTLTGDVTAMANSLPSLTTLNLAYNRLTGMSGVLPRSITSLNLTNQFRTSNGLFVSMDNFTPVKVMIGEIVDELKDRMLDSYHAIELYDHNNANFGYNPSYGVYNIDANGKGSRYGSVNYSNVTDNYRYSAGGLNYKDYNFEQDKLLMLTDNSPWTNGSAYPVIISWKPGDSNMDAITDVLDVQNTLNELLGRRDTYNYGFNYAAADLNSDDIYNILDVVKAVNIVLESQNATTEQANSLMWGEVKLASATVFADGNMIVLNALEDVAAIDVTLSGVTSKQIRQKLSKSDFQVQTRDIDGGVRIVIFSPNGEVIPAGETVLFTMSNYGVPTSIKCADANANELNAKVSGEASSVSSILRDQQPIAVRVSDGKLLVKCAYAIGMGHVEVYSTSGSKIFSSGEVEFKQGLMEFATSLTDGVYIVKVIAEEDCFIGKLKK